MLEKNIFTVEKSSFTNVKTKNGEVIIVEDIRLDGFIYKTIRHWGELTKNFFYLKIGTHDMAEIRQIVSVDPIIKAKRYSLSGKPMKWGTREEVEVVSLKHLQALGVLPDSLNNYTRDYCLLSLQTSRLDQAMKRALRKCHELNIEFYD